MKLPFP